MLKRSECACLASLPRPSQKILTPRSCWRDKSAVTLDWTPALPWEGASSLIPSDRRRAREASGDGRTRGEIVERRQKSSLTKKERLQKFMSMISFVFSHSPPAHI
jgi:hypothetical protein